MKCILALFTVVPLLAANDSARAADRPNIILMVVDDLGYNDLSCYGATKIITAGTVRKDLFVQVDLMATLAEAAGIPLPAGASPDGGSELAAFLQPTVAPAKRTEALLHGTKGIVLRQGDWIYFPKQGSLGYTAPEPDKPFGLQYAKMGFTNSDIHEHGQIKPGAPPEQLYNLATDLRQTKNLAAEQPDRVRAMRARLLELAGPVAGGRAEGRSQIEEERQ